MQALRASACPSRIWPTTSRTTCPPARSATGKRATTGHSAGTTSTMAATAMWPRSSCRTAWVSCGRTRATTPPRSVPAGASPGPPSSPAPTSSTRPTWPASRPPSVLTAACTARSIWINATTTAPRTILIITPTAEPTTPSCWSAGTTASRKNTFTTATARSRRRTAPGWCATAGAERVKTSPNSTITRAAITAGAAISGCPMTKSPATTRT